VDRPVVSEVWPVDLEPKALVSGPSNEPGRANIDQLPSAESAATKWIDLVGESVFGVLSD
jgi:hypothetical protein